jgi:hypothetical protein
VLWIERVCARNLSIARWRIFWPTLSCSRPRRAAIGGLGTDWRVASGKVTGLGLTHEGALIHLSHFNGNGGPGKGARNSRMARFTKR